MERKRVRVFRPQGAGIAMYEPGGQVPTADQGGEAEMILQAYVQSQQMTEQEAQQFMQSFMQMQPEQQQTMLSQIAEQLMSQQGSSMNQMASPETPMARYGGDLAQAKKGLSKKIKGVTADQNMTSDNVVTKRGETIMNSIGQKMMTNLIDEGYKMAQSQNMMPNPSQQAMMQMNAAGASEDQFFDGGSYNYNFGPFYGGYDNPAENPMIQNFYRTQNQTQQAGQNFLGAVGDLAKGSEVTGIKTRVRGDMFRDLRKQDEMSMARNGGVPKFQNAGTTPDWMSGKVSVGKILIKDSQGLQSYVTPEEAQMWNSMVQQDPSASLNDISFKSDIIDSQGNPARIGVASPQGMVQFTSGQPNSSNTQNNNSNQGSGYYTGPMGGFYFEDGQIKFGQPGTQGGQGMPGGFTGGLPAASSMQQLLGTYGAGAIGKAFQMMTPEDVYMSKFKTSAGIMGPRLVAKWKYKPDGSVERVTEEEFGDNTQSQNEAFGRRTSGERPGKVERMQRRGERAYDRYFGNKASADQNTGNEAENFAQSRESYNLPILTPTGGSGMGSMMNYNEDVIPNMDLITPPVKSEPVINRRTSTRLSTEPDEFAVGGMAGKLVMRNKYAPSAGAIGRFASPAMDFASSLMEGAGVKENEAAYTPGNWSATLRSDMPMSRGVWGKGPGLIGQEIPNLQPDYAEAYRFPQNPGEFTNTAPFNIGQNGGSFQYGGSYMDGYEDENEDVYYLDEDEIQDIMKRGGQIEYL
jgi:hypothetical protein